MSNKRQQIIDAVKARMQTITIGNAYSSNIGEHVFTWRTTNLQEAELPAIVLVEKSAEVSDTPIRHQTFNSKIDIMTLTRTIEDSLAAQSDVLKAIGTDPQFSTLVIDTKLVSTDLAMDQKDILIFVDTISLEIIYRIPEWSQG